MKTRVDSDFLEETRKFRLTFTCEACAHYVPESGECANGYPNQAHRAASLDELTELEFCKEFELV
jgi:hypothetical protein